jgi:hypothetical protein
MEAEHQSLEDGSVLYPGSYWYVTSQGKRIWKIGLRDGDHLDLPGPVLSQVPPEKVTGS